MKVTYWSDYACPYCYIGVTRLRDAIAHLSTDEPIEVEMRAFELDPDAPYEVTTTTLERFARKYGLSLENAQARIDSISAMGHAEGIEFNYATTLNTNMFDAHRLTKLAHTLGNTAIEELLYHAYFVENRVLADHDALREVAAAAGLPPERVEEVFAGDEFTEDVRADERQARLMGVTGVPFFVIDDKYAVGGCYPTDELKRVLLQAVNERKAEKSLHASAFTGTVCGPDGCREVPAESQDTSGHTTCGPNGCGC